MIVELEKRAVAAIDGAIRIKGFHIALANPGCFVDENIAAGERADRLREDRAVIGVGRDVDAKGAVLRARICLHREGKGERDTEQIPHGRLIKGLTVFATFACLGRMRLPAFFVALILLAVINSAPAQEKRSWLGRVLHPFGSANKIPEYKNPKLRGLVLAIELPPEPVKLSEVRQLPVHVLLTNRGDHAVELTFPSEQRIEILLHDSSGRVVTRWSENRTFAETVGVVLINPNEHIDYYETIATRELAPGRVFTVEVKMPAYPELDAQRKSLTAP